jgi:hypothetical protein
MTTIADGMRKALSTNWAIYETADGRRFKGNRLDEVKTEMRFHGWKNVSRIDAYDARALGLTVVAARYISGGRPAQFARDVVVMEWLEA